MRTKRQNIQLELALEPEAKGEARSAGDQGTEARMARAEPERPATGRGPLMEAVVEPGNLRKALARVRRNKGAPGIDGMTVEELGAFLKDHWPETRSRLLDAPMSRSRYGGWRYRRHQAGFARSACRPATGRPDSRGSGFKGLGPPEMAPRKRGECRRNRVKGESSARRLNSAQCLSFARFAGAAIPS